MAIALVRRPGRCLERLAATSSKEWSAEEQTLGRLIANWQATQLALTKKTAPAAVRNKIIEVP